MRKCDECGEEILEGRAILELIDGVVGVENVVPIRKTLHLCNEKCLREYLDRRTNPLLKAPRRQP